MRLIDAIDNIFSHNEIIAIWEKEDEDHDVLVWYGMAWQLPEEYKKIEKWQIVGAIADKITESDRINININDAVHLVQNAEPVVQCDKCIMHNNCTTEDAFKLCGIEDPFCCAGKRKEPVKPPEETEDSFLMQRFLKVE